MRVMMRRIVMVAAVVAIGRRTGEEEVDSQYEEVDSQYEEVDSQYEEVITSHWLPVDKWLKKRGDCKK